MTPDKAPPMEPTGVEIAAWRDLCKKVTGHANAGTVLRYPDGSQQTIEEFIEYWRKVFPDAYVPATDLRCPNCCVRAAMHGGDCDFDDSRRWVCPSCGTAFSEQDGHACVGGTPVPITAPAAAGGVDAGLIADLRRLPKQRVFDDSEWASAMFRASVALATAHRELARERAYHAKCTVAMVKFVPAFGWLHEAIEKLGTRAEQAESDAAALRRHIAGLEAVLTARDTNESRMMNDAAALREQVVAQQEAGRLLYAATDKLREQVVALKADAERLDWFDTQRQDEVDWSGHPEEQPVLRYCYWQIQAEALDIRSAIDAARQPRDGDK